MLLDANLEEASPAEVVALARLAESPEIVPPPHLRFDLEAKGLGRSQRDGRVPIDL